jgi:hypothetical protein
MRNDTYSLMRIVSVALVVVCGGCGSAGSDERTGGPIPSRTTTHEDLTTRSLDGLPTESVTTQKTTLEESGRQVKESGQREDHNDPADPSLPHEVANDLTSPDAHVRYLALDHWETKGIKAPLDPVFEAMEDEDEVVRARATAIIEQHWAVEKEKERD